MIIGLYCSDPAWLTAERAASLVGEADAQGVQLLFFGPSGIDESSATVQGIVYVNQVGRSERLPLPACVVSVIPGADRHSPKAEWLYRSAAVIAADLPADHEELISCFRQMPGLSELVEGSNLEALSNNAGAVQRYRLALSRLPQGGWSTAGIQPLGLASSGDFRHQESQEEQAVHSLQRLFADSSTFALAYMKQIAAEAAGQISAMSPAELPALYIDLAIDGSKRTRFCSAGIGEDEARAWSRAIAYAALLAGEAAAARTPLQRAGQRLLADKPTIGMMVGWALSPLFLEACHHIAESRGARFFYFYPRRVDVENRQIRGFYWQNGEWAKAYFPFPDVIYDRMRRKNTENAALYEALSHIPVTHELTFGMLDKIKVYRAVASDPAVSSAVIPFQLLNRLDEAKRFIDNHPKFILKPLRGSNGQHVVTGTLLDDGTYEIFDQNYVHNMTRGELDQLLAELRQHPYFVQQFIESKTREGFTFHIRVHLMKDGSGEWTVAFILPSFSLTPHRKITNHAKTFRGVTKWEWFLGSQFGESLQGEVDSRIRTFALQLAESLQKWLGFGFHEVGIDMGLDEYGAIRLFEANLNNVGMNLHEWEAAKHGIEYALWLLASSKTRR